MNKDTTKKYIGLMADEAEKRGEDSEDSGGNVRSIVLHHKLGWNAWFCVCCELADREARKNGFANQLDQAASKINWKSSKPNTIWG